MNVLIELEDEDYLKILRKKQPAGLTWKQILYKGADNI